MQVAPDWHMTDTKSSLEEKIGNGLLIVGPGFYLSNTDTLLLVREGDEIFWWSRFPDDDDTVYTAYVWNTEICNTILGNTEYSSVRSDTRHREGV